MTKGMPAVSTSGTTNTPRGKETILETSTQNVFTPGTPDFPEPVDMPDALSFQTAQERDEGIPIQETVGTDDPDIEDLNELGAPFAFEDLPDRGSYKEVFVEFPSCIPFSSFGESLLTRGSTDQKRFSL